MGRNVIDSPTSKFTVTNWTEDLTLSGTESTAANIAATLATVIKELQDQGILNGSTSA